MPVDYWKNLLNILTLFCFGTTHSTWATLKPTKPLHQKDNLLQAMTQLWLLTTISKNSITWLILEPTKPLDYWMNLLHKLTSGFFLDSTQQEQYLADLGTDEASTPQG